MSGMLALEVAILSEKGGRPYNEDACGHWHSDRHLCCVLADGAGGHGGGDVASRLVVEDVLQSFSVSPSDAGDSLNRLLHRTGGTVRMARAANASTADMHATVVCLVIDFVAHLAHWAHAGDSRLYWFRQGRVLERTRDHSLVQTLVDAGMVEEPALRLHPQRSELRSALGTEDDLLEVSDSGAPRSVDAGDVFLLCTDGLWEHLDDDTIEALLQRSSTPSVWLAALKDQVTAAVGDCGSHDNFTALAIWSRAT